MGVLGLNFTGILILGEALGTLISGILILGGILGPLIIGILIFGGGNFTFFLGLIVFIILLEEPFLRDSSFLSNSCFKTSIFCLSPSISPLNCSETLLTISLMSKRSGFNTPFVSVSISASNSVLEFGSTEGLICSLGSSGTDGLDSDSPKLMML